ncbi:MAG: hypothetical protein IJ104_11155 [Methanobrevibacter sp.]|nr:hypothetical protein [Methanobrevibacter sp.]
MKRILLILLIFLMIIPIAAGENITIKGVDFDIPAQYEHGTLKESSYVYQSGLTFRILSLDYDKNLKINYGDDIVNANSAEYTNIAGHDAVVVHKTYESKDYTTVYFATGDNIFLICFNDTYVNDDITNLIAGTPAQTMSTDEFSSRLNDALSDYKDQLAQEEAEIYYEDYQKSNRPTNRYFFFWL